MTRPNWSAVTVSLSQRNAIRDPISHTIRGLILIVLKGSVIHIIPIASMTIHYSEGEAGGIICVVLIMPRHSSVCLWEELPPVADKLFQLDPRGLSCIVGLWCCEGFLRHNDMQQMYTKTSRRLLPLCFNVTYQRGKEWPVAKKTMAWNWMRNVNVRVLQFWCISGNSVSCNLQSQLQDYKSYKRHH